MVFQSYALYPHMTVRENMGFALRLRKRPQREIDARVKGAAETLGLTELLDRRPRQLSGGQRQRVAIGRAIVREPSVVLFDEPLSNLDARLRLEARTFLKKLQKELGVTTIFVTHDQAEALAMADRMAVMQAGKIRQIGTPTEIFHRPANTFVANFIGSSPRNLLSAVVSWDGALVVAGPAVLPPRGVSLTAGRSVTVGARPEYVVLVPVGTPGSLIGVVTIIENLGATSLLSLELAGPDGVALQVMVPEGSEPAIGAEVAAQYDHDRTLLYDGDTGYLIGSDRLVKA